MDLVTFLRERLDEDEASVRKALETGTVAECWKVDEFLDLDGHHIVVGDLVCGDAVEATGANRQEIADFVARHDPARVLREVTAKRAIVDLHEADEDFCNDPMHPWPCATLRHLAAVYADHPDYDKEWTP